MSEALPVEVIDTTSLSGTFPQPPENLVRRANLTQAMLEMLTPAKSILIVGGPEGIGKTTLLAEFAKTHAERCISLFLSGSSTFAYDPNMITNELCDQLGWILEGPSFRVDDIESRHDLLTNRLLQLQRKIKYDKQDYFFVVDGLHEIPERDAHIVDRVLDLLPFGYNRVKFLISGNREILASRQLISNNLKDFRVIGFSEDDTKKLFQDEIVTDEDIEIITRVCNRKPGNMASIKRLMANGESLASILDGKTNNFPDWLNLEWDRAVSKDGKLSDASGLLAFYRPSLPMETLAELCDCKQEVLTKKIQGCSIFVVNDNQIVTFVCNAFQRIGQTHLSARRQSLLNRVIRQLFLNPKSKQSLLHLPGMLFENGQHTELISYLSEETLSATVAVCDSWVPLHRSIEVAIASAAKLKSDADLLRLCMKKSALTVLESSDPWKQEVEAYIAIEDYQAVSVLVDQAPTKEDQLQLLCVFAKSRRDKGLPSDQEIHEQIASLYKQIDPKLIGRRGIEIAADLLYSFPELAIELVQNCSSEEKGFMNSDIAFAGMSIASLLDKSDDNHDTHKELSEKIKNPGLQKYVNRLSMHVGTFSAAAVLAQVKGWDKPEDRITALRRWLPRNRRASEADTVMFYALDTILRTTAYTANAGVYREIISPLPYIKDNKIAVDLISRIDGLRSALEQVGPTTELAKIQATLARAEYTFNRLRAFDRLQKILFFIDPIEDCSTKMECYAVLVSAIRNIDSKRNFEPDLLDLAKEGLQKTAEEILSKTASHFSAIRPALSVLAATELEIALEMIQSLNTPRRRDRGFTELVKVISRKPLDKNSCDNLLSIISRIQSTTTIAFTAEKAIEEIVENLGEDHLSSDDARKLAALAGKIESPVERCLARCRLLKSLGSAALAAAGDTTTKLVDEIEKDWGYINCGWIKVNCGFESVELLAKVHPTLATELLKRTEELRSQVIIDSSEAARCYISCIRLAIRAFAGLMTQEAYTNQDIQSVCDLIERLPCSSSKVLGYAELAIKLHLAKRNSDCESIVSNYIKPILSTDFTEDSVGSHSVTSMAAVALYCGHRTSALRLIKDIPTDEADRALAAICDYVVREENPFENYGPSFTPRARLSYDHFTDILLVLEEISSDSTLCWAIEKIVDGFGAKRFEAHLNKNQQADVLHKLSKLANERLPNPDYIKHEGYRIIVEALLKKLQNNTIGWSDLVERAKDLPNYADSTFVLMQIAKSLPKKQKKYAIDIALEAKGRIPEIPFIEDRLHHFENLANICSELDKSISKDCVRDAWKETMPSGSYGDPSARKRLIDFAHRLDEEFASSLASELNADEGRDFARRETSERIEILKMRESMGGREKSKVKKIDVADHQVEVSHMMLQSLNAGRGTPIHPSKTRDFVEASGGMGMDDAYIIHCWAVENAVRKLGPSGNVTIGIRPLFEGAKMAAEISFRIAARKRAVTDSGIRFARESDLNSGLIRTGDRDQALERIRKWAESAEDFIKITDPFFGLEELMVIKTIREVNEDIPILILTSRKHQTDNGVEQPWEEAYQSYWRLEVADVDPGDVQITVIGRSSTGQHPIHDRWCLARNSGIRLGTSFNSIGGLKTSEISIIDESKLAEFLIEIDDWCKGKAARDIGEKVRKTTFEL